MPHGGQLGIPKPPVKLEYPMYLCNYDGQLGIGDDESKKFPTKFNMWMQSYGELGTNDHINHYIPVKLEGRRDKQGQLLTGKNPSENFKTLLMRILVMEKNVDMSFFITCSTLVS